MSNLLRDGTRKQRQELVYPYTELERLNIGAFLALLLRPLEATSGSVKAEVWLWQPQCCSRGTARICVLGNATTTARLQLELEEVGEGADKGNCCPQSATGETSIQQKEERASICNLNHVTFPWLKALVELGTRLHTRALSHGNTPAPAQAVPQKLGYRITQVIPIF